MIPNSPENLHRPALRRWLIRVLLLIVVVGVTEIATRLTLLHGDFSRAFNYGSGVFSVQEVMRPAIEDSVLHSEFIPGGAATVSGYPYRINSDGLRDRELVKPKPPKTYRIIALGDSITAGNGLRLKDVYHKKLARKLDGLGIGQRFESVNLGVPGYGVRQQARILRKKGLVYEPDLILVGFLPWDLWADDRSITLISREESARILSWMHTGLLRRSFLYSLIRIRMDRAAMMTAARNGMREIDWESSWRAAEEAYADIADAAAGRSKVMLVIHPPLSRFLRNVSDEMGLVQRITAIAQKNGFLVLDLSPHFPEGEISNLMTTRHLDAHPGLTYSETASQVILTGLLRRGLIPAKGEGPARVGDFLK